MHKKVNEAVRFLYCVFFTFLHSAPFRTTALVDSVAHMVTGRNKLTTICQCQNFLFVLEFQMVPSVYLMKIHQPLTNSSHCFLNFSSLKVSLTTLAFIDSSSRKSSFFINLIIFSASSFLFPRSTK